MKRVVPVLIVLLLVGRLGWMYLLPAWSVIETDFPNYYTAAWLVLEDKPLVDLYDPVWFDRERLRAGITEHVALFNYFTPFSALLMVPVAALAPLAAKQAWIVVSLGALLGAVLIVRKLGQVPFTITLVVVLLAGDALGNNFSFGQFYTLLTLLLLITFLCMDRRPYLTGAALGVAVLSKMFPAVFVAYLAWTRRWRALAWTGVALAIGTALGLAVIGWIPHRVFLEEVVGRVGRGEIQDPYNVGWNSLHALLRRSLMTEPGLNPDPIAEIPLLYFSLRLLVPIAIAGVTFLRIGRQAGSRPLIEYGALVAMVSLISPSQASYHHVLLFPAIVGARPHIADRRLWYLLVGLYALICSNYMGATSDFDSGIWILIAFPRVYLVFALWCAFLLGLDGPPLSWKTVWQTVPLPRPLATACVALSLVGGVALLRAEHVRWVADNLDGARMARPEEHGLLEVGPTFGNDGLMYSTLGAGGFDRIHLSARGSALVFESHETIELRLPDGSMTSWTDASEPSLGPESVVAIADRFGASSVVERRFGDSGWVELFGGDRIVHDLAVSDDGQRIAFAELVDGRYRISEWLRATGGIRPLLEGRADYRYPDFSPDGLKLAFATNRGGNWDVAEYSFDDGGVRVLTTSHANDFMPAYDSDGVRLFFASDRRRGYRFTAIFWIDLE